MTRTIPAALQVHMQSGASTLCFCWRIARRDGLTLGFTEHDRPLSFEGTAFEPGAGARGAALATSADLSVDNSEFDGALQSDRLSAADLSAGLYDGATVEVWRVNWADVSQRILWQKGLFGEAQASGDRFTVEVRGLAHRLEEPTGRLYQRHCDAVLGDGRCGVSLAAATHRASGTVAGVIDDGRFTADGLSGFSDSWFEHGEIIWTSGANQGRRGAVKAHGASTSDGASAALSLWRPAGKPVAAGDQFTITAGCDKRVATCADKFSNLINFRGFHLMPGNDFLLSYPLRGENKTGGSLAGGNGQNNGGQNNGASQ